MKKIIVLLVLVSLVSGCASIPRGKIGNSRIYNASYDKVWEVTLKATEGDILEARKENGFISLANHDPYHPFKYVNFSLGIVAFRSIHMFVSKKDEDHTEVEIDIKVMGSYSKGVLEKEYLDKIETVLNEQSK
ncbi:MAG: hypothetical protein PHC29_05080 [Candidatus Omnitrophica bacterium]|nr:hypothetical protein [Candidatus Omnitrophota bacterium]